MTPKSWCSLDVLSTKQFLYFLKSIFFAGEIDQQINTLPHMPGNLILIQNSCKKGMRESTPLTSILAPWHACPDTLIMDT